MGISLGSRAISTFIDMKVRSLRVDPITGIPAALLCDDTGRHMLTLFVGVAEATTIAADLAHVKLERPGTYDLLANVLGACQLSVQTVKITDYRRDMFFASVVIGRENGEVVTVDARPSDALALALRAHAPIRVAKAVIKKCEQRNMDFAGLASSPVDFAMGTKGPQSLSDNPDFPIAMTLSSQAANSNVDWDGPLANGPPGGKWKM